MSHTPGIHARYVRSNNLAVGLDFGSSQTLGIGPLLQDGNSALRFKHDPSLFLSVFGDLTWGGIMMLHHFNGMYTSDIHAVPAQSTCLLGWILAPVPQTPSLGWDWYSENDAWTSIASSSVWILDMGWDQDVISLQ